MLRRSWSLLPNDGLRCRAASPVDHRRLRRSQSLSGREMSKEMRMLDHYEQQHKRRLEQLGDIGIKLGTISHHKNNVEDALKARLEKLINDPLVDPKEARRIKEEMSKKINEVVSCVRKDDVAAALRGMQNKELEFRDKLELARTTQILASRKTNPEFEI